jgi:hypothetical protein
MTFYRGDPLFDRGDPLFETPLFSIALAPLRIPNIP